MTQVTDTASEIWHSVLVLYGQLRSDLSLPRHCTLFSTNDELSHCTLLGINDLSCWNWSAVSLYKGLFAPLRKNSNIKLYQSYIANKNWSKIFYMTLNSYSNQLYISFIIYFIPQKTTYYTRYFLTPVITIGTQLSSTCRRNKINKFGESVGHTYEVNPNCLQATSASWSSQSSSQTSPHLPPLYTSNNPSL